MNPILDAGSRMHGWFAAGKGVIAQGMGRMLRPGYWTAKPTAGVDFVGSLLRDADGLWTCQPDGSGGYRWEQGVNVSGDTMSGQLTIRRTAGAGALAVEQYTANASAARITSSKSRHATAGSHTIVQSGDELLSIIAFGSDGTNFEEAAAIVVNVDGTPGNNDMPGRIIFYTAADNTASNVERLRIDSTGLLTATEPTSGFADVPREHIFELDSNGSAIGAGIADFFGANSSISLPASSRWELEAHLYYLKTTAGTVTYTITNSAANYTNIAATYDQSPAAGMQTAAGGVRAGIVGVTTAAAALPATTSLTTAVNHWAKLYAVIDMNAAGSIRIRCTESAGTITPLRGSYYKLRRLPTSVGTFVA
jgi:hypothetical protein